MTRNEHKKFETEKVTADGRSKGYLDKEPGVKSAESNGWKWRRQLKTRMEEEKMPVVCLTHCDKA